MSKKLYGLFFYKLQITSFYSILERISGVFLLFLFYLFFLGQISINSFFFNLNVYFIYLVYLLFFFFLSFHVFNGFRIFFLYIYNLYSLKKSTLQLSITYLFPFLTRNSLVIFLFNFISKLKGYFFNSLIFNISVIFFFYFVFVFLFSIYF